MDAAKNSQKVQVLKDLERRASSSGWNDYHRDNRGGRGEDKRRRGGRGGGGGGGGGKGKAQDNRDYKRDNKRHKN